MSATRSSTPTAGACCTGTSSRETSSSASMARHWSSIGTRQADGPGRAGDLTRASGTLVPVSSVGSSSTLPGSGAGDSGLHESGAGGGRPGAPGEPRSDVYRLSGRPFIASRDRQASFLKGISADVISSAGQKGTFRVAPTSRSVDRSGVGGGLPQGHGPEAIGSLRFAQGVGG